MKHILGILVAIFALGLMIVLLMTIETDNGEGTDVQDWETYTNEEYQFTLEHPEGWDVEITDDTRPEPIVTIYKEGEGSESTPPYDHFANATFVSIMPSGLGTEGIIGQTRSSDITFATETTSAEDYLLEGEDAYATMVRFSTMPESWGEAGYVVGRTHIEGLETVCVQNGEEVSETACDLPMEEGAEVVRRGAVDQEERETVEAILSSFEFVAGNTAEE